MNDSQPIDPRRRIRELNAIPERDRTDEQWDELNELEIRTAPGNRASASDRQPEGQQENRSRSGGPGRRPDRNQGPRNNGPRQGQDGRSPDSRSPDSRPQEARTDRPPKQRQHRRPKRPADSSNGGGGSGGSNTGNAGNSNSGNNNSSGGGGVS